MPSRSPVTDTSAEKDTTWPPAQLGSQLSSESTPVAVAVEAPQSCQVSFSRIIPRSAQLSTISSGRTLRLPPHWKITASCPVARWDNGAAAARAVVVGAVTVGAVTVGAVTVGAVTVGAVTARAVTARAVTARAVGLESGDGRAALGTAVDALAGARAAGARLPPQLVNATSAAATAPVTIRPVPSRRGLFESHDARIMPP